MTGDSYDCTSLCSGASRLLQNGENTPTKCNAGGAFSCASIFTVQDRTPCYNNNEVRILKHDSRLTWSLLRSVTNSNVRSRSYKDLDLRAD